MAKEKNDSPKHFQKSVQGQVVGFKSPSRFGGGQSKFGTRSQYKPMPIRITQHKG